MLWFKLNFNTVNHKPQGMAWWTVEVQKTAYLALCLQPVIKMPRFSFLLNAESLVAC